MVRFAWLACAIPLLANGSSPDECLAPQADPSHLGDSSLMQVQRKKHSNKKTHHTKAQKEEAHVASSQASSLNAAEDAKHDATAASQAMANSSEAGRQQMTSAQMTSAQERIQIMSAQVLEAQSMQIQKMQIQLQKQEKELQDLQEREKTNEQALQQQKQSASLPPQVSLQQATALAPPELEALARQTQQAQAQDAVPRPPARVAPCQCQADSASWTPPAQRAPRCLFIDLGAADGNTFQRFLDNGYGPVANCPSGGSYEALLVEANPLFNTALLGLQSKNPGSVRSFASSAAFMCEGSTDFFLDTIDVHENFWGSSMSPNARDVKRSGGKNVTVPLVNVAKLIAESALPEDYVLLKMDIEGSEHDILPCLAKSSAAKLVDAVYVEKHPVEWSLAGAKDGDLQQALLSLQQQGAITPDYDSPM